MELIDILRWLGPGAAGAFFLWAGNKSRGKNGRTALKCMGWAFLLLYLPILNFPALPIIGGIALINMLLLAIPSVVCFLMAANAILNEMKAQQRGEYTDAAR